MKSLQVWLAAAGCVISPWLVSMTKAAEIHPILAQPQPEQGLSAEQASQRVVGKEVDWIYGDYVLQNETVALVIAQPKAGRNANMTVRGVGAGIIDASLVVSANDQLSAFYPTGGRYRFEDPTQVLVGAGKPGAAPELTAASSCSGPRVVWQCRSSASVAEDGTTATVTYSLADGDPFVTVDVQIEGPQDVASAVRWSDGVRADRSFQFGSIQIGDTKVAYCEDRFFRAAYGFQPVQANALWGNGRMRELKYEKNASATSNSHWRVRVYPATSTLDLVSVLRSDAQATPAMQKFQFSSPAGPVARAVLKIIPLKQSVASAFARSAGEGWEELRVDDQGEAMARLAPGDYQVQVSAPGQIPRSETIVVDNQPETHSFALPSPAVLEAEITDADGLPIPCKLTFYGADGTADPDFGPDSASGSVVNCVYCVHGTAIRPIDPGTYDLIISHGPEYDALTQQIVVEAGKTTRVDGQLIRSVDTRGWVSTELHSHSSPSGDNTSAQIGRVENLLCENLEFAPCTEHNRIDSYAPHLVALDATQWMTTCTGMELTGTLLPANHQNAFPLHHHPHTQDGGGPTTSSDPVLQIERLAMWDNGSSKVVQTNHPNLHQIYGDKDTDGKSDGGFRKMFDFMDVVEVHPLQPIFEVPDQPANPKKSGNRIFRWMKLLNAGYRIPGVVNTDAHYNHHGSGWLRNWFESSTDDPAKIDVDEMIHAAEHGHIVMSTGPFMEVELQAGENERGIPGDDVACPDGKAQLHVRIQCSNWLDINRVAVFINGRIAENLDFRRRTHGDRFGSGVVKFDQTLELNLDSDAHVIVAAIGEGLQLGRVMGRRYGKLPPVVVSNPIYVDRDGGGFTPNGDDLGMPLPRIE